MEREFVPQEITLELKELGFDKPCYAYYDGAGYVMIKEMVHCVISAPTFSQAFRWFREKYGLFHNIISEDPAREDVYWYGYVFGKTPNRRDIRIRMIKTYEEAELECLKKLIEIVKEKK